METCPAFDQLQGYVDGALLTQSAPELERHLDSCPSCALWVDEAWQSDSLSHSLRLKSEELTESLSCSQTVQIVARALSKQVEVAELHQVDLPTTDPDDLGIRKIREYGLVERLGQGGMGTVFKARHAKLNFTALKLLRADRQLEPETVDRFRREIEIVRRLNDPHIVRAIDGGEESGIYFLVMEYVDGPNLSQLVERLGPLSPSDACEIVRQAALGLEHAYLHELVHRDIKPSNVILNQQGVVKLLDLGLVRSHGKLWEDDSLTSTGRILGTVDYLAPEQADNAHGVDIRADVYSLGCTLYFLLSGHAPFHCETGVISKLMAHKGALPEPITKIRNDVSDELCTVLNKMLAKGPDSRFSTPTEVVAAVESLTAGSNLRSLWAQAILVRDAMAVSLNDSQIEEASAPRPSMLLRWKLGRRLFQGVALALAACLFAMIIISFRNRDGTKTTVTITGRGNVGNQSPHSMSISISQTDVPLLTNPQSTLDGNGEVSAEVNTRRNGDFKKGDAVRVVIKDDSVPYFTNDTTDQEAGKTQFGDRASILAVMMRRCLVKWSDPSKDNGWIPFDYLAIEDLPTD